MRRVVLTWLAVGLFVCVYAAPGIDDVEDIVDKQHPTQPVPLEFTRDKRSSDYRGDKHDDYHKRKSYHMEDDRRLSNEDHGKHSRVTRGHDSSDWKDRRDDRGSNHDSDWGRNNYKGNSNRGGHERHRSSHSDEKHDDKKSRNWQDRKWDGNRDGQRYDNRDDKRGSSDRDGKRDGHMSHWPERNDNRGSDNMGGKRDGHGSDDGYSRNDGRGRNDGQSRNDGHGRNDGYSRNDGHGRDDGYSRNDGRSRDWKKNDRNDRRDSNKYDSQESCEDSRESGNDNNRGSYKKPYGNDGRRDDKGRGNSWNDELNSRHYNKKG